MCSGNELHSTRWLVLPWGSQELPYLVIVCWISCNQYNATASVCAWPGRRRWGWGVGGWDGGSGFVVVCMCWGGGGEQEGRCDMVMHQLQSVQLAEGVYSRPNPISNTRLRVCTAGEVVVGGGGARGQV
jgi:hypothetical protein